MPPGPAPRTKDRHAAIDGPDLEAIKNQLDELRVRAVAAWGEALTWQQLGALAALSLSRLSLARCGRARLSPEERSALERAVAELESVAAELPADITACCALKWSGSPRLAEHEQASVQRVLDISAPLRKT